jgi:molecular chaperone HtpG
MEPKKPIIGKYILDSLSIGMYNHPLMLVREYIQNATDAIDDFKRLNKVNKYEPRVEIKIDGRTRCLAIYDNGSGIPSSQCWQVLHDIGNSKKRLNENRGFRGIGRLGGLGYCDRLIFTTKYQNERVCTINSWDCRKLKNIIKSERYFDTHGVLEEIIDYEQNDYEGDIKDHFFKVEMITLSSSRDMLLNVPLIKQYISEVAPVPFNKSQFSYAKEIESELKKRLVNYETYKIIVNGEQIYKLYADEVCLRGEHKDRISGIDSIELRAGDSLLAFGWLARMRLLGAVSARSNVDGVRVRRDNILIGNKDLLSDFFREKRFNNYLVGEIYTIDDHLVPNSRRDDFEDSAEKDNFYESFVKTIGLPISKRIRQVSIERSKQKAISRTELIFEQARSIIKKGYIAEVQKRSILRKLQQFRTNDDAFNKNISELVFEIDKSKHYLDNNGANGKRQYIPILKPLFELLYKSIEDKEKALKIINKILNMSP